MQGRGTGWSVWDAAAATAQYLEAASTAGLLLRHRWASVLELGSGTGLAGLAAAAVLRLPTLLTDLPEVLPALRRSVDANPSLSPLVSLAPLDWHSPRLPPEAHALPPTGDGSSSSGSSGRASSGGGRLVIAADCVWLEELVAPFVAALEAVATTPADAVLLAYQSRSTRVDGLLFGLLQRRFEVRPAPELPPGAAGLPPLIDLYMLEPRSN